MQTERNKHCTPVTIRISIPRTVTGIAFGLFVLCHQIVFGAFMVSQLGFCNSQNIIRPYTGQFHIFKSAFPHTFCFHIRCRIGITDQAVSMFLLAAIQFPDSITILVVFVCFLFLQLAGQRKFRLFFCRLLRRFCFDRLITILIMGMRANFRDLTGKNLASIPLRHFTYQYF